MPLTKLIITVSDNHTLLYTSATINHMNHDTVVDLDFFITWEPTIFNCLKGACSSHDVSVIPYITNQCFPTKRGGS